ncbi:GMC family oxidoreductase [Tropicibacter sp. R15_0]|uniref:FAD-dependent oxidoreductase n=1 Tax=Tropicibacter sp. R15_0 TaxID=2821101 RepID=UPI001ADC1F3B|nr:GMC family oxidoreductase [Tropicibacter sp. R15_0]MBO9467764.1 GMC family oxidoreductase [Tropicibacter sp. R15_0]
MNDADVIIIGSGIGGASMAAGLARSGLRILVLERGEFLRPSAHDRDAEAIFARGHYRPDETWLDGDNTPFNPGNYYCVGGNSKFFGAVFLRYREADFSPIRHMGGTTPGWPISYSDLAPWYEEAESLFSVRGQAEADNPPYPFPPVPHEPAIADLADRLRKQGLTPAPLPLGVDLDHWLAGGRTSWDAYPNTGRGKMDAETAALHAALKSPNVRLQTGARVSRLISDQTGHITSVDLADGTRLSAPIVVLAAGAVQSAALLLASANEANSNGLANQSDQVGRNFMNHNCSAVMALHPLRKTRLTYQKTLMLNDFYHSGGPDGAPLGNVQMLGKVTGPILAAQTALPHPIANWIAARSLDLYAMSEDLPNPDSRVTLHKGQIKLDWKRSNWPAHQALVAKLKRILRKAGYPITLSRAFDRRTPSHQCGTARMGHDPRASVVTPLCQSHDHPNLFITDASVLPTSAAVNPALTIAALALRSADHITQFFDQYARHQSQEVPHG